jgi:hypothetical protein
MEPYSGYYYNNINYLSSLKIPYQPNGLGKVNLKQKENILSANSIGLKLTDGNVEQGLVVASFNSNASDKFNDYDYLAPPDNFQSRSINIINSKLVKSWDKFLTETRKEIGLGQQFDIKIKNLRESGINLCAEGMNNFPGYEVYLVDMHLNKFYDMSVSNIIRIPGKISDNDYKLLIGTSDYIRNEKLSLAPKEFCLYQNYPNPFNPTTTISYSLISNSSVKIVIHNSLGELVKELVNGNQDLGYHEVQLDASKLASGVYFYTIQINSVEGKQNFRQTKKMILLK